MGRTQETPFTRYTPRSSIWPWHRDQIMPLVLRWKLGQRIKRLTRHAHLGLSMFLPINAAQDSPEKVGTSTLADLCLKFADLYKIPRNVCMYQGHIHLSTFIHIYPVLSDIG